MSIGRSVSRTKMSFCQDLLYSSSVLCQGCLRCIYLLVTDLTVSMLATSPIDQDFTTTDASHDAWPNKSQDICPNKSQDVCPNELQDVCPKKSQDVCPNKSQDVCPNKSQDVCPNKSQDVCPNNSSLFAQISNDRWTRLLLLLLLSYHRRMRTLR